MKSMRDSRREIRLIAAAFGLLFAVSLYRQLSIRFLPGDVIRPFVVFAVYVFLLGGWLHSIALRITQRFMLRCLRIEFSVMLIVMRVCLIYSRTRSIAQKKHRKVLPMLVGIAIPVIVVPCFINSFVVNFEVIELTAKVFFLEAMIWESCIMIGLVPVNTHYRTVFEHSTVGMRIIDSSGQTKISSTYAKELTPQELSELLENGSLTSDPTQYLYLHKLSEGELIYQQDVSDINILINELEQVSEELRQENTLLAKELNSRSEQAAVKAKNSIYNSLSEENARQFVLIENDIRSADTADRRSLLRRLCIIGTYVKRRCNLRLIEQEQGCVNMQELYISLNDIVGNLAICGIDAVLRWSPVRDLDTNQKFALFDLIEDALEKNCFRLDSIEVLIGDRSGIRFIAGNNAPQEMYISV